MRYFKLSILLVILGFSAISSGQSRPVEFAGGLPEVQSQFDSSATQFTSLNEYVNIAIPKILNAYQSQGFYDVQVDSIKVPLGDQFSPVTVFSAPGEKYDLLRVAFSSPDSLGGAISAQLILGEIQTSAREWLPQFRYRLSDFANLGYPVANWQPMKFERSENTLIISGQIDPGKLINLDTSVVVTSGETKPAVIIREARIPVGSQYNQRNITQARNRLESLPYVGAVEPALLFKTISGKYGLLWRIQEQRANLFDGILGYVPATETKKGYFTGQLQFDFVNLFGTGRALHIFWSKRDIVTQEMRLSYTEPWIAGFPIDITGSFQQTVQDTTYIKRVAGLQAEYRIGWNWRIYGAASQHRVLSTPDGRHLYNLRSYRRLDLTAGLEFSNFVNRLNPRRGIAYTTEVTRRQGVFRSDQSLQSVDFEISGAYPIAGRQILWGHFTAQNIITPPDSLPISELYRFGGANSVRGYSEDFFLGTTAAWMNLEYRYLFENSSRILTFFDYGYWAQPAKNDTKHGTAWSIGVGIRAATPVGQLGIDYGLPPHTNWREGRIHVRWQNYF